jgi:ubiquinone/menaquinone biosynthesis C-methylase UbiE
MSERVTVTRGFEDVDRAADPAAYAEYLERINSQDRVRALNRRRAEEAGVKAGDHVLDLGCGVGADALLLAELVAPTGRVVGIDQSATMVERAAARGAASGLPVEFRTGDVHALPFADASFDVAWTERVLIHVADPGRVVREMVRILRPGGTLVIAEPDHHADLIDASAVDLTQRLIARHVKNIRNAAIGRQVRRLCLEAGVSEVRVRPKLFLIHDLQYADQVLELRALLATAEAEGLVARDEAAAWWAELEAFDRVGSFLLALPFFVTIGRVGIETGQSR